MGGLKIKAVGLDLPLIGLITAIYGVWGNAGLLVEIISVLCMIISSIPNLTIRSINKYYIWNVSFFCVCVISAVFSSAQIDALYGCRGVLQCLLIGTAFSLYLIDTKNSIQCVLKYMIYAAFLLTLRLLLTTPWENILQRELGDFINSNTYGMRVATALLFAMFLVKEKYVKISFFLVCINVFGVGILLSGSKKALLLLAVGFLLFLFFYCEKWYQIILFFIGVVLIVFVALWALMNIEFLYNMIGRRLEGMIRGLIYGIEYGDASTEERVLLIQKAIEYWKEKPWMGYGVNTFGAIVSFSLYSDANTYSHCNYTELLFGVGIIGTLVYYSIYAWLLSKSYKFQKKYSFLKLFSALLISIIVIDVGLVSYADEFIQLIIAFCCFGVELVLIKENGKEIYVK